MIEEWNRLKALHGTWAAVFLVLLTLVLPSIPMIIPALIALSIMALLLRHRPLRFTRFDLRSPLPWMLLLYVFHIIGMLWTEDIPFGLFDLEIKLALALIPLLFLLIPTTKRDGGGAMQHAFVWGNVIIVPICLIVAFYYTVTDVDIYWEKQFIASYFSLFLHPTYAAMYLCMALAFIYLGSAFHTFHWRRPVAMLLLIGIILMASKLAWLAVVFLVIHVLVSKWNDPGIRKDALFASIGFLGGMILLVSFSEFAAVRLRDMKEVISGNEVTSGTDTSSGLRLLTWKAAAELIREQPLLGTGTGDIKNELMEVYAERSYAHAFEQRLNAHGQFIQTAAALGIPGLLLLIAAIVVPGVHAIRKRDHLMISFLGLNALNWTVESMLEVQAGVVFFSIISFALMMQGDRSEPVSELRARSKADPIS